MHAHIGDQHGNPVQQVILQKVVGRAQVGDRLVLGVVGQRLSGAKDHALHELQLQRDVVLGLVPVTAFQLVFAQRGEHLGAGLLHEQTALGRVHRLVRIGGGIPVHAVADERAHVIDGELGHRVVPGALQVVVQLVVALIGGRIARGLGKAHLLQLAQRRQIHLFAEQTRQHAVGSGAGVHQLDEVHVLGSGSSLDDGFFHNDHSVKPPSRSSARRA